MTDSILETMREACQLPEDDSTFDNDIIPLTNTVLMEINQVGVGTEAFTIDDVTAQWSDFFTTNDPTKIIAPSKTYIGMKVRMMFDPPTSSVLRDSLQAQIDRIEWRILSAVDYREEN